MAKTDHKVWTFVIRGGEGFDLRLPRTPKCEHAGLFTMWKLVGNQAVAEAARALMEETGATVELHTEYQTEELTALRRERLGMS